MKAAKAEATQDAAAVPDASPSDEVAVSGASPSEAVCDQPKAKRRPRTKKSARTAAVPD